MKGNTFLSQGCQFNGGCPARGVVARRCPEPLCFPRPGQDPPLNWCKFVQGWCSPRQMFTPFPETFYRAVWQTYLLRGSFLIASAHQPLSLRPADIPNSLSTATQMSVCKNKSATLALPPTNRKCPDRQRGTARGWPGYGTPMFNMKQLAAFTVGLESLSWSVEAADSQISKQSNKFLLGLHRLQLIGSNSNCGSLKYRKYSSPEVFSSLHRSLSRQKIKHLALSV